MKLKQIKLIEEEIADYTELGKFLELPFHTYSKGMQMRLGFAVSTTVPADIILMDEWLSVGDSDFLKQSQKKTPRLHSKIFYPGDCISFGRPISKLANQVLGLEHET